MRPVSGLECLRVGGGGWSGGRGGGEGSLVSRSCSFWSVEGSIVNDFGFGELRVM